MELLGLCCAACVAFGDPTHVLGTHDGVRVEGLAATTFRYLQEPVNPPGESDGFHLQEARLAVAGDIIDEIALYGALGASDQALDRIEAYGDAEPVPGLRIRAGRWRQGLGMVSGRRVEQRCFADVPLHTARFLSDEGLYDQGLRVGYLAPIPHVPILVSASMLHGQSGASFGQPAAAGEGSEVFERLLYVVRVAALGGADGSWGPGNGVTLGFTFATGQNATGVDNRTDLIGVDAMGRFQAGEVQLGLDLEYLMRRYSIPDALFVEGGLSVAALVGWRGLHAGLRADLMGLPEPPDRARLDYRVTAMAGYSVTDLVRFRLQYSARNDTPAGDLGHEVLAQAIVGLGATFGGAAPTPPPRSAPPSHEPLTAPPVGQPALQPQPVESTNPTDWLDAAVHDLETAQKLADTGRHSAAAFHAQQAAYKALRSAALKVGAQTAALPRSALAVIDALAGDGSPPPADVWAAARELDRQYTASRAPSELGGQPERYFDRQASARAVALAQQVVAWAATQ